MPRTTAAHSMESFHERFGKEPSDVAFAPGRVNIIGEHTDYNEGLAMPAAVDLATFVSFSPRKDNRVRVYSDMAGEEAEFELAAEGREGLPFWATYVWGTGMSLLERGAPARGFDGYAATTVPQGGGLSSSASFEVALALAYLGERSGEVAPLDLAHICRHAENAFVGVNCGLMDQFASIFGSEGRAIVLDCRSLEYRNVSFPDDAALVVADTGVRHALGESGYHDRQEQCREAVSVLAAAEPGVRSLRDATLENLEAHADALGDVLFRRARHVITENDRVADAAAAMEARRLERLGALMRESHRSLQNDFEVSCDQLDAMVESAEGVTGHFGSRMTGGGFGGCTVSLVETSAATEFAARLAARYTEATGLEAATHVVRPGRGAGLLGTMDGSAKCLKNT